MRLEDFLLSDFSNGGTMVKLSTDLSPIGPGYPSFIASDSDNGGLAFKVYLPGIQRWKADVVAASTGNVNIASAPSSIDGVSLVANDRVFLTLQSNKAQNGIYVFASAGAALTRSTDCDTGIEIAYATARASGGTANSGKAFEIATGMPITVGTTNLNVIQLSSNVYTGTPDQITISGFVISIASTYVGQASITTLGVITSGGWNGSVIDGAYGGTGVANTGKTITLGGNFATSGAFATTLTVTATTNVTLPTAGTLATLAGSEALTNKTYNGLTITTTTGTLTLTNGKTLSVSNTLTFSGTDSSSVAFGAGGTVAYLGTANVFTTGQSVTLTAQAANTELAGYSLINSTPASSGNQQYSPYTLWQGQGWKTDATAGSQSTQFIAYVKPVQGTARPTMQWILKPAINGAANTTLLAYETDGAGQQILKLAGTSSNQIHAYSDVAMTTRKGFIYWDGSFMRLDTASTLFDIQVNGSVSMSVRTTATSILSNLVVGTVAGTVAASATNSVHVYNGTAPSGSATAGFVMYSANQAGAGTACAFFRTEGGSIIKLFQNTTAITASAFVANTSGIANDTATWGGYTGGQIVAALQANGLLQ